MARIHARNARLFVGATNGAAPSPLPFTSSVNIDSSVEQVEVTSYGDTNKAYVTGLPDFSGSISGYYDSASTAATDPLWVASRDGLSRKFYLYPDFNDTTKYFYGEAFFDFSMTTEVNGAVATSSNLVAAGSITRVG